jgi:hypothetical protein
MFGKLQAAWYELFPLPPTAQEIVAKRMLEIDRLHKTHKREQRQREREEQKMHRKMQWHQERDEQTEARMMANSIARSKTEGQEMMRLDTLVQRQGMELKRARTHMEIDKIFLSTTQSIAQFNHTVPAGKILLASMIFQRERSAMDVKREAIAEVLAEEQDPEEELEEEAEENMSQSKMATRIFDASADELGLKQAEDLDVPVRSGKKTPKKAAKRQPVAVSEEKEKKPEEEEEEDKELWERLEALGQDDAGGGGDHNKDA